MLTIVAGDVEPGKGVINFVSNLRECRLRRVSSGTINFFAMGTINFNAQITIVTQIDLGAEIDGAVELSPGSFSTVIRPGRQAEQARSRIVSPTNQFEFAARSQLRRSEF